MAQKSILEEALLQIENLEEAMKQNSKGILSSTMKGELKGLLESEDEKGSDVTEDPDEEDVPAEDVTSADDENVEDDEDEDVPSDDMGTGDEDVPSDDMTPEDEDVPSDDMGPEDETSPMSEPQTLDMTKSSDEEVLRVFKAMKPEDGIIVKKDGNNLEIEVSGDEYIIKLDELDDTSDLDEEDMVSDEYTTEEETNEEESMSAQEETVYEIELDEEDTHEGEVEDTHEESKVKKSPKKVEATEAARTKSNPHGNKGGAQRAGLPSKKMFKAGSESKVVNEEFNKLKKQNQEYKKALVLFKDKLNEVAVFNANLAYATRLFTEHSTTKQEKLNILKRFDSVSSMNESKKLYSTIKNELDVKKPVTETVVDKITSTSKSSSSKNVLAESKAYENPQFKRMKDLMNKIK